MIASGILIGFYILAFIVGLAIMFFVGMNVPLIIFDKSLWVFDLLSGTSLVNNILFPDENSWGVNDSIYTVYLVIVIVTLLISFVVVCGKLAKRSFGFGVETQNWRNSVIWIIAFISGIFLMPMIFFVCNFIITGFSALFNGNASYTIEVDQQTILNNLEQVKLKTNDWITKLEEYLKYVKDNKAAFISQTDQATVNKWIDEITNHINEYKNFQTTITNLIDSISKSSIENNEVKNELMNFQKEYNNLINKSNSFIGTWAIYNYEFEYNNGIKTETINITPLFNQLIGEKNKTNSWIFEQTNNIDIMGGIWNFADKNAAFPIHQLTKKIGRIVFGTEIHSWNLYDPVLTITIGSIGDIFNNGIHYQILKLCIVFPILSVTSTTIFLIVVGLVKRLMVMIFLLISSPFALGSGIYDDGVKFALWLKKAILCFSYLLIVSIIFNLYVNIVPSIIDLVENTIMPDKQTLIESPDYQSTKILLILGTVLGTTYGVKKMIDLAAEIIGEINPFGNGRFASTSGQGANQTAKNAQTINKGFVNYGSARHQHVTQLKKERAAKDAKAGLGGDENISSSTSSFKASGCFRKPSGDKSGGNKSYTKSASSSASKLGGKR